MNKKGFTLVELIVSFAMISILSLVVFRTTINIQQKQSRNIAYSNYVTFYSAVNNVLQNDLVNKTIEELEFCGRNCYKIKYEGEESKELSIDIENKLIRYGGFIERLPVSFKYYMDLTISEDIYDAVDDHYNAMLTIRIPINSTILPNDKDLFYIYQYNSDINPITSKIS
ncbi:MAG: prepilin-type N-terminal cleavage/methylation domain-containing protein [Bacilli bacterium]|nr:prepilin-type N-terminal cleavage/methylation domain-containing protein [Bacilli bacterium]